MCTLLRLASDTCAGVIFLASLSLPEAPRDELRLGDLREHVGELRLHELVARDGPRELLAVLGVVDGALEARLAAPMAPQAMP
jgi:hypothetical protein